MQQSYIASKVNDQDKYNTRHKLSIQIPWSAQIIIPHELGLPALITVSSIRAKKGIRIYADRVALDQLAHSGKSQAIWIVNCLLLMTISSIQSEDGKFMESANYFQIYMIYTIPITAYICAVKGEESPHMGRVIRKWVFGHMPTV